MRRLLTGVTFTLLAVALHGEVTFSGLDISPDEVLLFSAVVDTPGYGEYTSLFRADLSRAGSAARQAVAGGDVMENVELEQLSFFPETLTYLPELDSIQVHNRFGLFRARVEDDGTTTGFGPVSGFASFVHGATVAQGRLLPVSASPDGRYLLVLEPVSAAWGRLVLVSTDGLRRSTVAERVELSTTESPARWSPDSQFFIYARSGELFYYSVVQFERGRLLEESFRRLGDGTIASVRWSADGSLHYVRGSLVYRIIGAELFVRSLYAGLLQTGRIIGKLPFPFDPNFDSFWVSPDGASALLSKGGRNLFVLYLNTYDFADEGQILALPSLFLPRNTRIRSVQWTSTDHVTILTAGILEGSTTSTVFRLSIDPGTEAMQFVKTDDRQVRELALSPDEQRVAVLTPDRVTLRSADGWRLERTVAFPAPLQAVWLDSRRLLIGGTSTIEIVDASTGARTVVAPSQASTYSVAGDGRVYATAAGRNLVFDGRWRTADQAPAPVRSVSAGRFRVFLESLSSGVYRNIVMVRRADSVGTSRLFPPPERAYEPFPDRDEPVDLAYFTHGSRIRGREVAFAINAIDTVEGLTEILNTLASYGVQATFFVNGEFIRRHPAALAEIAASGHEVGSLFSVYFDMSDRRFRITREFITEGLARNEDDYFAATGRELSLLWHAPYYFSSAEIVEAGWDANYIYVGRDVDSLDWVPRRTDEGLSQLYLPAAELVERILELKRPGSIISMQIGTPDEARGGRDDYLFQRLGVLINGLLELGYRVVPVSALIETAR